MKKLLLLLSLGSLVLGCNTPQPAQVKDGAPLHPRELSHLEDAVPQYEEKSKYGNPLSYEVFGKRYHVKDTSKDYKETGYASWYGTHFHGKNTSSGTPYDMYEMTAAHKTLPLPTYARVTNLENGKSAIVKINDRGPFHSDRIVDLSYAAAHKLGVLQRGTGLVEVIALTSPGEPLDHTELRQPRTLMVQPPTRKVPPQKSIQLAKSSSVQNNNQARYVQLGAYSSQESAKLIAAQAQDLGHVNVLIKQGLAKNKPIYRVHIGPFNDERTLQQATIALSSLNEEPLIVSE